MYFYMYLSTVLRRIATFTLPDLPGMHTHILAAIQFRFLDPIPTADAREADEANTRVDAGLPIEIVLEPNGTLLQDRITVTVTETTGTATRKSL